MLKTRQLHRDVTGQGNYSDSTQFRKRKRFNAIFLKPKLDIKKEIIEALRLNGSEKILDVGCGFGDLLAKIKKAGHRSSLAGVDLSNGMIAEARQNKGINFKVTNAEHLPFPASSFDVVICKHVLYHVNNIPKAICEIRRVLKPGGLFAIVLNSQARGAGEKIEGLKKIMGKAMKNRNVLLNNLRINTENYHSYLKGFTVLKEIKFFTHSKLKDAKPVIEYMDSFREFWQPIPSQEAWKKALKVATMAVSSEIRKKGVFSQTRGVGIIIAQKAG